MKTSAPTKSVSSQTQGRNNDQVREHNLAAILTLLSQNKSLTRSALATLSGMNRSTISVLMTELQALGLVSEISPDETLQKGRPSFVASLSSEVAVFGVNIESKFTDVCLVTLSGEIIASQRISTPKLPAPQQIIESIAQTIEVLLATQSKPLRIGGIGVAVPGQIRLADGLVRLAPHLRWVEAPFGSMLEEATGMPVFVGNNATLGATAEHAFGAAKGYSDIVYLYSGTSGIGGGVIVGGELLRGAAGYAGELGHVVISDSPSEDYSGFHGTLESLIRQEDMFACLGLAADDERGLETALAQPLGIEAQAILESQSRLLAAAISSFANIFNPQLILLGGYLGAIYAADQTRLAQFAFERILSAPGENLHIRRAELGPNQIIKGAAGLAISALIRAPKSSSAIL